MEICTDYYPRNLPKGDRENNDCTIIAFAKVFNVDYKIVSDHLLKFGKKRNRGMTYTQIVAFLETLTKFKAIPVKGRLPKLQCKKFIQQNPTGTYFVTYNTHALAIIDGILYDHSDTTRRFIENAWRIEKI